MKTEKQAKTGTDRRSFLRFAALGGAGVLGGTVVATSAPRPVEAAAAPVAGSSGYRETEHTRAYYASARF